MTKLYQNVKLLCKEEKLSLRKLESATKIPENSLANWKEPRRWSEYLLSVSNFFDVSIDFLFGRTQNRRSHSQQYKSSTIQIIQVAEQHNFTKEETQAIINFISEIVQKNEQH